MAFVPEIFAGYELKVTRFYSDAKDRANGTWSAGADDGSGGYINGLFLPDASAGRVPPRAPYDWLSSPYLSRLFGNRLSADERKGLAHFGHDHRMRLAQVVHDPREAAAFFLERLQSRQL